MGALTHYSELYSACDLKASQLNVQHTLIHELMPYKFKLCHNAAEATKNISCAKSECEVDHSTVTRWFKKFSSGCKNLNMQARSCRSKTVDSKATLQAIEACSTCRLWGRLDDKLPRTVWFITFTTSTKHQKQLNCTSCCILTFDRAECSSCVNNVIARHTCINKREHVTWVTTGIHGDCEIIYTHQIQKVLQWSSFNLENWV